MKGRVAILSLLWLLVLVPASFAVLDLTKLTTAVNVFDGYNVTAGPTTITTKGPSVKNAKYYVHLTGASYCNNKDLKKWTCLYCTMAKGQSFSAVLNNSSRNTQALVTTSSSRKEIVVTFRGSYNVQNFLQDATLIQTTAPGTKNKKGRKGRGKKGDSSIQVHQGFLAATNSLYPLVVAKLYELLKANPGYRVVITGHSLGAAMAAITLYMLQQKISIPSDFPTPTSYSLYVYGEPRSGNQAWADYWNSQKIQITRTVNNADIVPHMVSALLGYYHHGNELWINIKGNTKCNKKVYEDPKCSNSKGPLYNPFDHLQYFDVNYVGCAAQNPISVLTQFAVDTKI